MRQTMRGFVLVSVVALARHQSTQLASFALTRFVQLRSLTGAARGLTAGSTASADLSP